MVDDAVQQGAGPIANRSCITERELAAWVPRFGERA
jgi:hypothetical protein